jgi:hypothetical protein
LNLKDFLHILFADTSRPTNFPRRGLEQFKPQSSTQRQEEAPPAAGNENTLLAVSYCSFRMLNSAFTASRAA